MTRGMVRVRTTCILLYTPTSRYCCLLAVRKLHWSEVRDTTGSWYTYYLAPKSGAPAVPNGVRDDNALCHVTAALRIANVVFMSSSLQPQGLSSYEQSKQHGVGQGQPHICLQKERQQVNNKHPRSSLSRTCRQLLDTLPSKPRRSTAQCTHRQWSTHGRAPSSPFVFSSPFAELPCRPLGTLMVALRNAPGSSASEQCPSRPYAAGQAETTPSQPVLTTICTNVG